MAAQDPPGELDYLRDDVAEMTLVIDAPLAILPEDDGVVFNLNAIVSDAGERQVRAVLVRGTRLEAVSDLPAPANNRIYHLFAFSEADKALVRDFQQWALDLESVRPDLGARLQVGLEPKFCKTIPGALGDVRISVYVSLPGRGRLSPLLSGVGLSDLGIDLARIPNCVQT